MKEMMDGIDYVEIKNFCFSKDTIKRLKTNKKTQTEEDIPGRICS